MWIQANNDALINLQLMESISMEEWYNANKKLCYRVTAYSRDDFNELNTFETEQEAKDYLQSLYTTLLWKK